MFLAPVDSGGSNADEDQFIGEMYSIVSITPPPTIAITISNNNNNKPVNSSFAIPPFAFYVVTRRITRVSITR
jgi:hypothetical protein